MNEVEFRKKYEEEREIYYLWGEYVTTNILKSLSLTEDVDLFLKIPPKARVKDTNSLIMKAFYRKKDYQDPYNEIEDKVGTRFVVLLTRDVHKVARLIEECTEWNHSKDRDFEEERAKNPTIFEYQSVHYVVRNKDSINYKGNEIPRDTPCEIQIRTLLQHAYSELTHDTIYKPRSIATPIIHRKVARCMALIETTDDMFGEVDEVFSSDKVHFDSIITELNTIYKKMATPEYERKLNLFIFDAYKELLTEKEIENFVQFVDKENEMLRALVNRKYDQGLIYRQPMVLLLFFLILKYKYKAKVLWPLTENLLRPMYSELGIAFD